MLQRLHIQNFAIIDKIDIQFSEEMNIITGETGAGKSILMHALSLILGERADSNVLANKERKCIIEGNFQTTGHQDILQFLQANELDQEEQIIIRREISQQGKSRAFVNDTPVTLSQLKQLGKMLVDLHQQFDTLELGENDFQLQVLDAVAENLTLMQNYRQQFAAFQKAKQTLAQMQQQQKLADETADYNRFLLEEFEELNLQPGELETLEEELKLLSNAETVKIQLSAVAFELSESELPIVQQFRSLIHKLQQVEKYYPQITQLIARLQSVQIEAQDIAGEISDAEAHIQYDAERIQQLNERMEKGYRLLKKHHVQTTAELCDIQQVLQEKMNNLQNIGLQIEAQAKLVAELEKDCRITAQEIATNRNKAAIPFSEKINELLWQVGMPNARIQVSITPTLQLTEHGIDQVALLFDANKTNRFEPISKVASGGELSRLMLCIKSLVARKLQLPTLIFDEIDTGISGEAAKQVGIIMKRMSAHHQIFAITHQPQIAAKAKAHYFVYKQIEGEKIHTAIRLLGNEERITIIAQMLSGAQPTAAAMQNAKEMVEN